MKTIAKINLDLQRPNFATEVDAMQDDGETRVLEVSLTSGGTPWNVPDGAAPMVVFRRPNYTKGMYDQLADGSPAISVDGNTVTVVLSRQMLAVPGQVRASLQFEDAQLNMLTTFPFKINVQANPYGGAQSVQDVVRLQWLEDELGKWLKKAAESGEFDGPPGPAGKTPEKGVDYFTTAEKQQFEDAVYNRASEKINPAIEKAETAADAANDAAAAIPGQIAGKLDKPAVQPAVGQILKVQKVNPDGTFVVGWADDGIVDITQDIGGLKNDLKRVESDIEIGRSTKSGENYLFFDNALPGETITVSAEYQSAAVNLRYGNRKNLFPVNADAYTLNTYYYWVFKIPKTGYLSISDADVSADIDGLWLGVNGDPNAVDFSFNILWFLRPDKPTSIVRKKDNVNWVTVYLPYGSELTLAEALSKLLKRFHVQLEFGTGQTAYEPPTTVQHAALQNTGGKNATFAALAGQTMVYNADRDTTVTISTVERAKINEVVQQNSTDIGDLNNLKTQSKTNLVDAINDVVAQNDGSSAFPRPKKYFAVGDSITHGYNHTFTEKKQYWRQLQHWCGFVAVDANGEPGTCIAEGSVLRPMISSSRIGMIPTDSDVISVFGGTNDWGNNYPLGTMDSTEQTTFYGALKSYMDVLIAKFWDKQLFFITPIQRNCNYSPANGQSDGTWTNANGNTLEDFANAIIDVCSHYGVPCLDLYHDCFDGYNDAVKTHYLTDGLHPVPDGHTVIARKIAKFINFRL